MGRTGGVARAVTPSERADLARPGEELGTGTSPGERAGGAPVLSRGVVLTLAAACGLVVANLYYAQPLLHLLSSSLGVSVSSASDVVTATQIGYAGGLAFLVPVGDLVERRRLVVGVLGLTAVAALATAAAPSLLLLAVAAAVLGTTSVVAQVLVPLAADLAPAAARGRVVGTVMSGLLLGILLARTASGLLAAVVGWRGVYLVAAGAMLGLAGLLWAVLPTSPPPGRSSYSSTLRSTARLVLEEPVLPERAVYGAAMFAAFSVFWTTMSFLLSGPPYRYSSPIIGLFGLAGAAGAMVATVAGRWSDRGRDRWATATFVLVGLASFAALAAGGRHLGWLLVGVVALDVATQGLQITNQGAIYRLRPDARSRLTAVYMTAYFVGGSLGSLLGGLVYEAGGWGPTCGLGAAFVGVAAVRFLRRELGTPRTPTVPVRRSRRASSRPDAVGEPA